MDSNKKDKIIRLLIIIIVFLLGVVIGYGTFKLLDNNSKETNTTEEKQDENEEKETKETISVELLEELKIIGEMYSEYASESFYPLLDTEGLIKDFTNEKKLILVYQYALRKNMVKMLDCHTDSRVSCDGSGQEPSITKEDFNKILKKYDIDNLNSICNKNSTDCREYDDLYILFVSGDIATYSLRHDIEAKYEGNSIIVTDLVRYYSSDNPGNIDKTKLLKYTFKKNNNSDYFLYSVYNGE